MKLLALDLSLTATGWATVDASGVLCPPRSANRDNPRLQWIRDSVLELAEGTDLVILEGYSYGSKGRAVISIGELGGVIRLALFEKGYRYVEVPPSCLKKAACGKGNVNKEAVLAEAIRRLGYEGCDHNESDALWLLQMALAHYGLDAMPMPKLNLTALAGVSWPERNP